MLRQADIVAADYIVALWGKRRRQYAREYWLHLTRDMPRPPLDGCFGGVWIEHALNKIERLHDWPRWRGE